MNRKKIRNVLNRKMQFLDALNAILRLEMRPIKQYTRVEVYGDTQIRPIHWCSEPKRAIAR